MNEQHKQSAQQPHEQAMARRVMAIYDSIEKHGSRGESSERVFGRLRAELEQNPK